MTIDKYTKVILTLIAVGILGLNFHLYSGSVVKKSFAEEAFDSGYKPQNTTHTETLNYHEHPSYDIWDFEKEVKKIVSKDCMVGGGRNLQCHK